MIKTKARILVVDDDVQHVDTVKTLLESVGYSVDYAYLPEKAIEKAKSSPPDLILLDVMFAGPPGPDGVETSRRIHADAALKKVPVIILSGVRKVLDLPFKLEPDDEWMPVTAFLEKPVKPDKLLAEIARALGK
ncbi:MAG: response regulator [Acidobacteria bacterium]|nr:MAG: response regulator [Acidobacteriota bacterium]